MAIGPVRPQSVLEAARSLPGWNHITNYFTSTKTPPTHKPNEAWNNPINNNVAGMFQLYYQNTHGIPRDEVQLDHITEAHCLGSYMCS